MCVRVVWSVMQESGEYLYSVGDVGVGSVFGENDVLVCAVVVQVDTVAVKERVQASGEWCCSAEGALFHGVCYGGRFYGFVWVVSLRC